MAIDFTEKAKRYQAINEINIILKPARLIFAL